uniref:BRCT domain-containing protein n=1 Tax=Strongyloides papillosus TaxID=174720 RepID=A0A0N5B1P9_STREA
MKISEFVFVCKSEKNTIKLPNKTTILSRGTITTKFYGKWAGVDSVDIKWVVADVDFNFLSVTSAAKFSMLSLPENEVKLQRQANTQPNNPSLYFSMLQVKKSKASIDDPSYKVVEFIGSNLKLHNNVRVTSKTFVHSPYLTKFSPRVAPIIRPSKNVKERAKNIVEEDLHRGFAKRVDNPDKQASNNFMTSKPRLTMNPKDTNEYVILKKNQKSKMIAAKDPINNIMITQQSEETPLPISLKYNKIKLDSQGTICNKQLTCYSISTY